MTEKRFEFADDGLTIYDNENDDYICFEYDLEDLLNEQDKRIKELEEENDSMKGRIINAMVKSNQVECNCTTCVCEDYVNEELKKW